MRAGSPSQCTIPRLCPTSPASGLCASLWRWRTCSSRCASGSCPRAATAGVGLTCFVIAAIASTDPLAGRLVRTTEACASMLRSNVASGRAATGPFAIAPALARQAGVSSAPRHTPPSDEARSCELGRSGARFARAEREGAWRSRSWWPGSRSEPQPGAGRHHRPAAYPDGGDDLLGVDPLQVPAAALRSSAQPSRSSASRTARWPAPWCTATSTRAARRAASRA
jgi:hypothetical protein